MENTARTNREYLENVIRDEEGKKLNDKGLHIVYKGPKTGWPHACYGHLLKFEQSEEELAAMGLDEEPDDWFAAGLEFTDETAEKLLQIDIEDAIESLESTKKYPGFTEEELEALDPERYVALINMAFQLGGAGVRRKFPSFVQAVHNQDWDRAADEMLWSNGLLKQRRSQWYKDTPRRCQEMADKMRNGTIVEATEVVTEVVRDNETLESIRGDLLKLKNTLAEIERVVNEALFRE